MASGNNDKSSLQHNDDQQQSKGQQHQDSGHSKSRGGQHGGQPATKSDHRDAPAGERTKTGQTDRQANQTK